MSLSSFSYEYKKIDNKELYLYKGCLEDDLLAYGVSEAAIQYAKNTILEDSPSYLDYPSDNTEHPMQVPINQIIGVSRGTPGESVFDSVNSIITSVNGIQKDCLDKRKFSDFIIANTATYSINEFNNIFPKLLLNDKFHPVRMIHYIEKDDVTGISVDKYYQINNGSHRTLLSILFGATTINALVIECKVNEQKKQEEEIINQFYETNNIVGIYKNKAFADSFNYYMLKMKGSDNNSYYYLRGYKDVIDHNNNDLNSLIFGLTKKIIHDKQLIKMYSKLPLLLKKSLCSLFKSSYKVQFIQLYTDCNIEHNYDKINLKMLCKKL